MSENLQSLIAAAPQIQEAYDVSTPEADQYFTRVKRWLAETDYDIASLDSKAANYGNASIALRTILKFIESERIIEAIKEPVTITLINPVYKEKGRMSRRSEHPHGENSIRMKIETLNYFNSINPNFNGRIYVIDDECPDQSGKMAEEIIAEYANPEHKVYFLGQAIEDEDKDLPVGLTKKSGTNRSVKGGSVLYGMRKALNNAPEHKHIIIDNDADLSVHPMQIGLIINDILTGIADAVAGSRREEDSVALIGDGRNQRGTLFIDIWKQLLPQLGLLVTDTNRAFKAFDSAALALILPQIKIYTFPYQIELLQACISNNLHLRKKGIAYIDSEAASTQSGENITETYLNQIHQIIDISRRYQTIPEEHPLVQYFLSINEEEWLDIERNPPDSLEQLYS